MLSMLWGREFTSYPHLHLFFLWKFLAFWWPSKVETNILVLYSVLYIYYIYYINLCTIFIFIYFIHNKHKVPFTVQKIISWSGKSGYCPRKAVGFLPFKNCVNHWRISLDMILLHLVLFCSEQEANTLDFLKSNLVLTAGNSRVISVPTEKKNNQPFRTVYKQFQR